MLGPTECTRIPRCEVATLLCCTRSGGLNQTDLLRGELVWNEAEASDLCAEVKRRLVSPARLPDSPHPAILAQL